MLLVMCCLCQSVSLVLTKLRIRYKGDHKCRLAANTGLTLLPLNLAVLQITRTFQSTSCGCCICPLFLANVLHVMHGLISTYNYLISSCAYPRWAWHNFSGCTNTNRSVNPAFLCCVVLLAYYRCSVAWYTLALTSLDCKG